MVDHACRRYAEMELRLGEPERAREVLRRATATGKAADGTNHSSDSAQRLVCVAVDVDIAIAIAMLLAPLCVQLPRAPHSRHKQPKLWQFRCDLEESLGTFDSTRAMCVCGGLECVTRDLASLSRVD